jgi:protein-tyrosine phosphatase
MAEGVLNARLSAEAHEWTTVESAGTLGLSGTPPSGGSVEAARAAGVDITAYRSRPLDAELVDEADLILVMEPYHKDCVLQLRPDAGAKTYLLGEFDRDVENEVVVGDPIGCTISVYMDCYKVIQEHIDRCLPAIEALVKKKVGRMAGG